METNSTTLPTWDSQSSEPVESTTPAAAELVRDLEAANPPEAPATPPQSQPESQPTPAATAPPAPVALEPPAAPVPEGEKPNEVEKPTTESVEPEDPDEPEEIKALTPIPSARKWAKQQYKDAAPIRNFLNYDKPISEIGTALYELSPSRYTEHVFNLLDLHSKEIFGVPLNEVRERLGATTTPSTSTQTSTPPTPPTPTPVSTTSATPATSAPAELTEQEIDSLPVDQLRARINQQVEAAAAKAKQETESALTEQLNALREQLSEVKGTVESHQTTEQQREINTKSQELYDRVWSVVTDGIRELGLEAKADDTPRIAALKGSARALLNPQAIDDAYTADEQNSAIMKVVKDALHRREFQNAFREEDNLKVRVRGALHKLAATSEVKAILDEIAASAQSPAPPLATGPIPPVPGSTAGVTLKPPSTWDEAEQIGAVATA